MSKTDRIRTDTETHTHIHTHRPGSWESGLGEAERQARQPAPPQIYVF